MQSFVAEACQVMCALVADRILKEPSVRKRNKRRCWTRKWILQRGATDLIKELNQYPEDIKNLLRMSENHYQYLLEFVTPKIQKNDTNMREAIPAKIKLQITLRYLATGDSFKSLEFLFRVPKSSISKFIEAVLDAVCDCIKEFIKVPEEENQWLDLVHGFHTKWNFPNCIGALDGKHVVIRAPPGTGSDYFNYKQCFSIILLALIDHNYCFTYIDVGAKGRASDGGVWRNSTLYGAMEANMLNIPSDSTIVADDAFPLTTSLLKPYSKRNLSRSERIFNYRLSRARRISENAFGILVSKFRIFERPIAASLQKVDKIVTTFCSIHNWLRKTGNSYVPANLIDSEDENYNVIPGTWRQVRNFGLINITESTHDRNSSRLAITKRDEYCNYFNNDGAVPWQWSIVEEWYDI